MSRENAEGRDGGAVDSTSGKGTHRFAPASLKLAVPKRGLYGAKLWIPVAAVVVIIIVALGLLLSHRGTDAVAGPAGTVDNAGYTYSPSGASVKPAKDAVKVVIYTDLQCPHCAALERESNYQLNQWVQDGTVTVEYRVVSFLDKLSKNQYSSRAANAVACAAERKPEAAARMVPILLANQPAENTAGPDNKLLNFYAQAAGAPDVSACIQSGKWNDWVRSVTQNSHVTATPTVYVNGKQVDNGSQGLLAAVQKAMPQ